jgi:NADH:ubiquinone reductase (H+-translocating)
MSDPVVVIGGGFGGLQAALVLGKAGIPTIIIDRRNHHLFQPLLYQVATGGLSPGDIASPLRNILRKYKSVTTVLGEVTDIQLDKRLVIAGEEQFAFKYLIVASGSETSYFGRDDWEPFATGLKTVEEATEIRSRIFYAFEQAELEDDPNLRRQWLTFIIVGGGPTGVELAGTLGEIARDTLRGDFRRIRPEEARILLVDGNERVLGAFPESLSSRAENDLIKLGVRFRNNCRVVEVNESGATLKLPSGEMETVSAKTVLWAAGVKASPLGKIIGAQAGVETDRTGRVKVQPDCSLLGHAEVFVVGDLANFVDDRTDKMLPGVAQVAMQGGTFVAENIVARQRGEVPQPVFRYWDKGNMATIGRLSAVADLGKVQFSGVFAWLLWLAIHLVYLVEFRNRVIVAVQWGYQYLSFYRGARLITGMERFAAPKTKPRE